MIREVFGWAVKHWWAFGVFSLLLGILIWRPLIPIGLAVLGTYLMVKLDVWGDW